MSIVSNGFKTYVQQGNVRMVLAAHDRGQIPGTVQQLEGSADLAVGEVVQCEGGL